MASGACGPQKPPLRGDLCCGVVGGIKTGDARSERLERVCVDLAYLT